MASQETLDTLRAFILKTLIKNPKYKLGDEDKLITGGLIDSFSLVEVQLFIEKQFGFLPPDIDMTVATMDTLRQIGDYVDKHRK